MNWIAILVFVMAAFQRCSAEKNDKELLGQLMEPCDQPVNTSKTFNMNDILCTENDPKPVCRVLENLQDAVSNINSITFDENCNYSSNYTILGNGKEKKRTQRALKSTKNKENCVDSIFTVLGNKTSIESVKSGKALKKTKNKCSAKKSLKAIQRAFHMFSIKLEKMLNVKYHLEERMVQVQLLELLCIFKLRVGLKPKKRVIKKLLNHTQYVTEDDLFLHQYSFKEEFRYFLTQFARSLSNLTENVKNDKTICKKKIKNKKSKSGNRKQRQSNANKGRRTKRKNNKGKS